MVFHRGDNVWNQETFDPSTNEYRGERVPIKDNTLIAFNRTTGVVVYEYGKDLYVSWLRHSFNSSRECL